MKYIFCVGSILNVFLQIIFCSKVFWAHGALESYFILQMSFIVSIFRTFLHCFSFKRTQKSGAGAGLFCHFDLQISMIIKKYIYQECLPKSLNWRCYSCGSSKEYGSKKNEFSVYQLLTTSQKSLCSLSHILTYPVCTQGSFLPSRFRVRPGWTCVQALDGTDEKC